MYDIWIDIGNVPRVLFFKSLLDKLREKYSCFISIRPNQQIENLMEKVGLEGKPIGKDNPFSKSEKLSIIYTTLQFTYKVPDFKTAIILEGSRPIFTTKVRDKNIINFLDNDLKFETDSYVQKLEMGLKKLSDFFVVPECSYEKFSDYLDKSKILKYSGYKEHISILNFVPNEDFTSNLPFEEYIVIRPESFQSFYVKKDDSLIPQFIEKFSKENINIVYLPRGKEGKKFVKDFDNVYVPPNPLNGLDLSYHARATLTGSGTMAREAAVLGTPAVSFFPGDRLLAVDQDLVDRDKMLHSRDPREIVDYVLANWDNQQEPEYERAKKVKKEVIGIIDEIVGESGV